LIFVDDIILFGTHIVREASNKKKILDFYCKETRMEVNKNKSNILFNKIEED
jgi:exopolyphosphatase/pppGpp-phosphohydrolase